MLYWEDFVDDAGLLNVVLGAQVEELCDEERDPDVHEHEYGRQIWDLQAQLRRSIADVAEEVRGLQLAVDVLVQHEPQTLCEGLVEHVVHDENEGALLALHMRGGQQLDRSDGHKLRNLVEEGVRGNREVLLPELPCLGVLVLLSLPEGPVQLHGLAGVLPQQPGDVALRLAEDAPQSPPGALVDHAGLHDGDHLAVPLPLELPARC
mmetsp:Transcript_101321/g.291922  ORF Transcript_101321/g.291922 Transcript_101321/m.291922 type:complete len:207 (+) Transcript_101321:93-713(+)